MIVTPHRYPSHTTQTEEHYLHLDSEHNQITVLLRVSMKGSLQPFHKKTQILR